MEFGNLMLFWLLPFIIFLCYLIINFGNKKRDKSLKKLLSSSLIESATKNLSKSKKRLKQILYVLAFCCVWLAMTLPRCGTEFVEKKAVGIDIMFAVDVSKSMLAEDIKPNRLNRTKLEIERFASQLQGNRMGLIAFAGASFLQCPLTLDFNAFLQSVDALDTNVIFNGGTSIEQAIRLADKVFSRNSNDHVLILFSDGEELSGNVLNTLKRIKKLKIFTIGVGDENGCKLPISKPDGSLSFIKDRLGRDVISKLNKDLLTSVAKDTGGIYIPLSYNGLNKIYEEFLKNSSKSGILSYVEQVPIERYNFFVLLAIFFLLVEQIISTVKTVKRSLKIGKFCLNRFKFLFLFLFIQMLHPCFGIQSRGDKLFNDKKFDEAITYYKNVLKNNQNKQDVEYNLGTTLLHDNKLPDASKYLKHAVSGEDLNLKKNALYNLGIVSFLDGESKKFESIEETTKLWEDSLQNFSDAVELDENFSDAVKNYKFVKQRLEELKQQQSENNQEKQDKSESKENKNKRKNCQLCDQSEQENQNKGDSNNNQGKDNNSDAHSNPEDDEKTSNKKDQEESSEDSQEKNENSQDKPQQNTANKESSSNINDEFREGKMSLQEAQMILDDESKNERKFPLIFNEKNEDQGNNGKDW